MRLVKRIKSAVETFLAPPLIRSIRAQGLTYLSNEKYSNILYCLKRIASDERLCSGDFAEFGVALGGSAIFLCKHLPEASCFFGFDVFGMIPPPSELDDARSHERYEVIRNHKSKGINGNPYYGYETDLYRKVVENFASYNLSVDNTRINLIQGLFEETVPARLSHKISFAHVDCDWYKPVRFCLEELSTKVLPGGYIVLDDYNDYGGCKKATDEFLANSSSFELLSKDTNAVLRRRNGHSAL